MRAVFWLLLIAALAVAVALLLRVDDGYVIVVYPPWRVEMSVALAVGLIILSYILGYLLVRVLHGTLSLPGEVRSWRERRRQGKAEVELTRAIGALIAGQPDHARKLAQQSLEHAPGPMAALVAARAALDLGQADAARALLPGVATDLGELIAARQSLERQLAEPPQTAGPSAAQPQPGLPWNSKESE